MLRKYPTLVLSVLLFINILAYVDRNMLLGFSPQIVKDLSLTNTQFGFLSGAVWVFSYSIMVLVFGSLADRMSRTRLIALGMLAWSVCTAASGLAENFSHMVMARFLVASGEAALVPAATALLADIFDPKRRSTANGLFFTGIPLGLGLAFVLSGTVGATFGWRHTFLGLGVVGVVIGVSLLMVKDDAVHAGAQHDHAFLPHLKILLRELASRPGVIYAMLGMMLVHFAISESSFIQLWLVRERGASATMIAQRIGALQILFGCLGASAGGVLADRMARHARGGMTNFPVIAVAVCVPLMLASRFVDGESPWIYAGIGAGAFLSFAVYGGSLSIIQNNVSVQVRSSAIGFMMLLINVIPIASGTLAMGYVSDKLKAAGMSAPLTTVLIGVDLLTGLALVMYLLAARKLKMPQVVPLTEPMAPAIDAELLEESRPQKTRTQT